MEGTPLSGILHINSPWNRANRLSMHIFQEWYCDMMVKMVTVKPPKLFYALWEIVKHVMNENTQKKLAIVMKHEDLLEIIDPKCVPVSYGGEMRDTSGDGIDPESCMRLARPITEKDYWEKGQVWRELKITPEPEWKVEHIRPKSIFTLTRKALSAGIKMGWQFKVNGEITFAIRFEEKGI